MDITRYRKKPIHIIILLSFILLLSFIFLLNNNILLQRKNILIEEVGKCNTSSKELRFSCYRNALEKHFQKSRFQGIKAYVKSLENKNLSFHADDNSYAVFGTNCHTFYHAVGDLIASKTDSKEDLNQTVSYCSNQCTSGCIMGLYKRLALDNDFNDNLLKNYYGVCPKGSEHQCTHEIGHILHDKYVTSILKPIDEISVKNYGLNPKRDYKYTKFDKPNLNKPFEDCVNLVPEDELAFCYTGIGHNLFLFADFLPSGYKSVFQDCDKTDSSHKEDCYAFLIYRIGINDAAVQFMAGKEEEGNKICNDVVKLSGRQDLKQHCYLGVGGGIGLFLDSEFANTKITTDNIGDIQKTVLEHISMCDKTDEQFKKECYRGLLGTKVKKLYQDLNLYIQILEELLPKSDDGFQVVG